MSKGFASIREEDRKVTSDLVILKHEAGMRVQNLQARLAETNAAIARCDRRHHLGQYQTLCAHRNDLTSKIKDAVETAIAIKNRVKAAADAEQYVRQEVLVEFDENDPISMLRAARKIFYALTADDVEFDEKEKILISAINKHLRRLDGEI